MPRLTRLYTRKGDDGTTGLGGGQRVGKDSLRVAAYGTVDELSSALGVALALGLSPRLAEAVPPIQNALLDLGADLCVLDEDKQKLNVPQLEQRDVDALERMLDDLTAIVGPLENFILPGGTAGAAQLHVARTVCRRAEREVVALSQIEPVGRFVVAYLNRLSDLLFAMARYENHARGTKETLWERKG